MLDKNNLEITHSADDDCFAADPIRVGLLGAGTVGSQTARLIVEENSDLSARIGAPLELAAVACLHPEDVDAPWISKDLLSADAGAICKREDIDIIVELIGGLEPAHTFVKTALECGKSVVTANKALLAKFGPELYECAQKKRSGFKLRGVCCRRNPNFAPT